MICFPEVARAPAALELEGIAHRFGSRWILRGCRLSIQPGEAVALIGGNGTGKTTLLRVIATLLRPTRGEGKVLGHDLRTEATQVREHIGLMGFSAGLYEDLTAAENLSFAIRMRGQRATSATIEQVLEQVGLSRHVDARVRALSSGMRRRLSLARVLLHPPRLLLLDEPYAALDDEGAELINSVIRQITSSGGAVFAATHDLPRAIEVMDRTVRLEAGVLSEVEMMPVPSFGAVSVGASRAAPGGQPSNVEVVTCR
jgi:heme exporter protein A